MASKLEDLTRRPLMWYQMTGEGEQQLNGLKELILQSYYSRFPSGEPRIPLEIVFGMAVTEKEKQELKFIIKCPNADLFVEVIDMETITEDGRHHGRKQSEIVNYAVGLLHRNVIQGLLFNLIDRELEKVIKIQEDVDYGL